MANIMLAIVRSNHVSAEQIGGRSVGWRRLIVPLTLAAIALAGLLLRLDTVSTRPIWFDEAWSWRMSRFPLAELMERTAADVHPPLYYVLLKAWTTIFGDSPLSMRSLSVLFSTFTIFAVYELVRQANPRHMVYAPSRSIGAALFVAALVALSVFQIRYGWEARMYALGTFLYAASGAALFRALRTPSNPRKWWAIYGVLIILFAYTHYFALLSIAAQGLFLAGYFLVQAGRRWRVLARDRQLWRAFITYAVFVAALLPWSPVFLRQLHQVHEEFWPSPVSAWSLPVACYQMFVDPENAASYRIDCAALAVACACGLAALMWKGCALEWYAICGAVLPCATTFFLGLAGMRVFYIRYLVFAHAALLMGLGLVVWRVPILWVRLAIVFLLLADFAAAYVRFTANADPATHSGARAAAAYLAERRQPNEPVVVSCASFYFPLKYYLRDRDCYLFQGVRMMHSYQGGPILIPSDVITEADLRASHSGRLWVVNAAHWWGFPPVPVPAAWKHRSEKVFLESFRFQGDATVVEYDVPGG